MSGSNVWKTGCPAMSFCELFTNQSNIKKKFLLLLFCISTAIVSSAAENGYCGKDGENLRWELSDDDVLTISGTGEMKTYMYNVWGSKEITSVVVEEGVTNIGQRAFYGMGGIESVSLPPFFILRIRKNELNLHFLLHTAITKQI